MNNTQWEQTGRGQYELKEISAQELQDRKERKKEGRKKGRILHFVLGMIAGAALMLLIYQVAFSRPNSLSEATQKKIGIIERVVDRYYLWDRTDEAEADGIYKGIMSSLGDKYAYYYTAEELKRDREDNAGQFSGIGCTIGTDQKTGAPYVVSIMEGYSADKAGIKEGDFFLEVDGEDATAWSSSEVASHVKGKEGTTVDLLMYRDGEELSFTVERVSVDVETVTSKMLDEKKKIGYIRIAEFDQITVSQFKEAKKELEEAGMKGLILDLRSNPGGLVDACADIASEMLPEGMIVYAMSKDGHKSQWTSDGKNEIHIPVVILVNGNTASSAEILTGAMKDHDKATVMGTKTYGKGIIQNTYSLGDGTAIEFTAGQYYLPKDECIHEIGIEPDIEVEADMEAYKADGTDNQLEAAQSEIEKELDR
jgi:carboxyl-terminal processing protease